MGDRHRVSFHQFAECCNILRREWVELNGCVIKKESGGVRKMLRKGMSPMDVELLFNHEHMSLLAACFEGKGEYTRSDAKLVSDVFVAYLQWQLRHCFPERSFVFEVVETDDDITIRYYQERWKEPARGAPSPS